MSLRTTTVVGAAIISLVGNAAQGAPPAEPAWQSSQDGLQPFTGRPDFFPIATWDRQEAWRNFHQSIESGLQSVADCNFTVAGFVRPEDLPVCEKLGLAAIVAPSEEGKPWFREWRELSDEDIDRTIKSMVEKAGHSKAVIGYTIMDEPGAPAFAKLAKAVAAVKKHAPGKLAHINLYPNYATIGAPDTSQLGTATYPEYLERFVTQVKPQFLCYDNYMVEYSDDLQDAGKAALYYANLLEVRRVAQKYHLPFWNVVCCNQIRRQTTIPSPANLAFQAYTTLAAGGRGITWFKYHQGGYAYAPMDNLGQKTEIWHYLQAVNQQVRTLGPLLNRLKSTGVFFTPPPPQESLPLLPGRIIRQVQSKASPRGFTKAQPPLMVGEFTDQHGTDYVMLVNLSLERSTNIKLETVKPYTTKRVFSTVDGRLLPLDEPNGQWLVAGHGILMKLE
jgi:hypothetical protein